MRNLVLLAALTLLVAVVHAKDTNDDRSTLRSLVRQRVQTLLDELVEDGDQPKALNAARALFDQTIAHGDHSDGETLAHAAWAVRLVRLVGGAEPPRRQDMLTYLRANPALARRLVFLVRFDVEDPVEICRALDLLRAEHGRALDRYAGLAAAICVVHDKPLSRRINENQAAAPNIADIFGFYKANERRMLFGVRKVPAEVLIFVVDTSASIQEMRWALSKYAGDREVGARFFDIRYDQNHFRTGAEKAVTRAGYHFPNILRHGGVCADQAYFAASVGKSIGVPTAYVIGRSGQMGHAWVGFLQARGKAAVWNFDTGRYEAYRAVQGVVQDPQTRSQVPDAFVSLMAELIGSREAARHAAAAYTDAAVRLGELRRAGGPFDPPPLVEMQTEQTSQLSADVESQLSLLEAGLRRFPGDARAWFTLRDLATDGQLSLDQMKRWASVIQKFCGRQYPDFVLAVLAPMIASVEDVEEQNRLWEQAFTFFRRRPDLAARVRMEQGRAWEKHGRKRLAGRCYEDVINRYANTGPFVIEALEKTEKMLLEVGEPNKVPQLYARTWESMNRPKDAHVEFRKQSNWYKVGMLLVEKLESGEHQAQADAAKNQIERVMTARARGR